MAGTVSVPVEIDTVFKILNSPPEIAQFERQWSRINCIEQVRHVTSRNFPEVSSRFFGIFQKFFIVFCNSWNDFGKF